MAGTVGEGTTQGLDDLNNRCAQYKKVIFYVYEVLSAIRFVLPHSFFYLLDFLQSFFSVGISEG